MTDSQPFLVIDFTNKAGVVIPLHVNRFDDPETVAQEFCWRNSYPETVVPKLTALIRSQLEEAIRSAEQFSGKTSHADREEDVAGDSASADECNGPYRSYSEESYPGEQRTEDKTLQLDELAGSYDDRTGHEESFDSKEDRYNEMKEIWSSKSESGVRSLSALRFARELSTSASVNGRSSSTGRCGRSRSPLRNQAAFDHMYAAAGRYEQRRQMLRNQLEKEREKAIANSSYRAHHTNLTDAILEQSKTIRQGNTIHERLYSYDIKWVR